MFSVEYANQATKFLKKAEKELAQRLLEKIEELRKEPVPHNAKTVEGYKETIFRVRVGNYRILYDIDYKESKIGIIKIDKRAKVYE